MIRREKHERYNYYEFRSALELELRDINIIMVSKIMIFARAIGAVCMVGDLDEYILLQLPGESCEQQRLVKTRRLKKFIQEFGLY